MAENEGRDEISSIMERLWGPRGDSHVDAVAAPRQAKPKSPPDTGGQAPKSGPGVVVMSEERHGEAASRARADLEAFQAQVALALADLVEKIARIRNEVLGVADTAAADVETRVLARVDVVERNASERLAALDDTARVDQLEQRLNQEIVGLSTSVEATHAGFTILRSDLEADVSRLLQEQRAEVEQVLAVRDGELQAEISSRLERAVESADDLSKVVARVDAMELDSSDRAALDEGLALRVDRVAEALARETEANRVAVSDLQTDLAAMSVGMQQFARRQEDHMRALNDVIKSLGHAADADRQAATALEGRITDAVDGLAQRVSGEDLDLRSALEAHAEELKNAVEHVMDRVDAANERVGSENEQLRGDQADLTRQLGEIASIVQEIQGAQRSAQSGDGERVRALEAHVEQSDEAISDLGDYHAALDVGMGAFRSEMARMRDLVKKLAKQQAEVSDRLDGIAATAQTGESDEPKGGKKTRR